MASHQGGGWRGMLGIAAPKDFFTRTLAALPPGTKVRQSRADETDPMVSGGCLLYAGALIAALFTETWGLAIVTVAGLLLGGLHGLAETGGPVWRFLRLLALPALAVGPALWAGAAPLTALALLLPPVAGYLCVPAVRSAYGSRQSSMTMMQPAALPRWLRRATDSGRAVAVVRKYPRDGGGEELLARDREALGLQGYELADEVRIGDPPEPEFLSVLDEVWSFVNPLGAELSSGESAWIYTIFVKSSVLHRHSRSGAYPATGTAIR